MAAQGCHLKLCTLLHCSNVTVPTGPSASRLLCPPLSVFSFTLCAAPSIQHAAVTCKMVCTAPWKPLLLRHAKCRLLCVAVAQHNVLCCCAVHSVFSALPSCRAPVGSVASSCELGLCACAAWPQGGALCAPPPLSSLPRCMTSLLLLCSMLRSSSTISYRHQAAPKRNAAASSSRHIHKPNHLCITRPARSLPRQRRQLALGSSACAPRLGWCLPPAASATLLRLRWRPGEQRARRRATLLQPHSSGQRPCSAGHQLCLVPC